MQSVKHLSFEQMCLLFRFLQEVTGIWIPWVLFLVVPVFADLQLFCEKFQDHKSMDQIIF